jgi:cytochrome c-type biogenesis protein CcmF
MELGQIGHAAVILSFISALFGMYALAFALDPQKPGFQAYTKASKWAFGIHAFSVFAVVSVLFAIIYTHQYQYHYAWSHSSSQLPAHYMISCFWEGQEGSFLLWIFWHVLIGFFLLKADPKWRSQIWMVYFSVQAFLVSMLLGAKIPGLDWKIGSSPFILLREVQPDAPVFAINPDYVPEDGRGLNPLLQNYWMVIHPPTLFLGFALALVPFCYAVAALWTKRYTEWIRPAIAWTSLGAGIMGIGIAMGAYWAYETLNFGGYWNWDPVENAVYIPWLLLVASLHLLMLFQSRKVGIGSAFILVMFSFVLVLYATFLTRSGILGNASVHSFTDLGLSGQLLVYLLAYLLATIILLVSRWGQLPHSQKEMELYSKEFWISAGVLVLFLASFQVFATTSIPVYNALSNAFGYELNLAPPSDPIAHYTVWQMGFFMCITLLTGIGQFFFWRNEPAKKVFSSFTLPVNIALAFSIGLILWLKVDDWKLILLLTLSLVGLIANGQMLFKLVKAKSALTGGALSHIGVALVLIGILFSSGYNKIISLNTTGAVYRKDFSTEMNRDNVLMWRHRPEKMGAFTITYKGPRLELKNGKGFIEKDKMVQGAEPYQGILSDSALVAGVWKKPGDTLEFYPENTYYQIEYQDSTGNRFTLYPRAQVNPNMGLIASPDIRKWVSKDLYTHVTSIPSPDEEKVYSDPVPQTVHMGDTFFINDHVAILKTVRKVSPAMEASLGPTDAAVEAIIKIFGNQGMVFEARPVFLIRNQQVGLVPDVVEDIGARISLSNINPTDGTFTILTETTKVDWIIMKAMEKPGINLLWLGVLVMSTGFGMSVYRRFSEEKREKKKR